MEKMHDSFVCSSGLMVLLVLMGLDIAVAVAVWIYCFEIE